MDLKLELKRFGGYCLLIFIVGVIVNYFLQFNDSTIEGWVYYIVAIVCICFPVVVFYDIVRDWYKNKFSTDG